MQRRQPTGAALPPGRIRVARVYDDLRGEDAARVLVDRVWPRGVKRADLALYAWARPLAPSTELRRWYGHRLERWTEFRRRYLDELAQPDGTDALADLQALAADQPVVLLTATRDVDHSQAAVLAEVVQGGAAETGRPAGVRPSSH